MVLSPLEINAAQTPAMLTAYIHWNVDPELLNIAGISLRYYGLLFVGGLALSAVALARLFKANGIPPENVDKLAIYGVVGILVGARLGHCLFYEPGYYLTHLAEMLLPVQPVPGGGYRFAGYQGLASHGGAVGLALALYLFCRKTKLPFAQGIDYMAIVVPLAACFIRLANLMNSEILGYPTEVPWAFVFHRVDDLPRHPAQLYEALSYLAIFGLQLLLYRRSRLRPGSWFYLGVCLTAIFSARFALEFVKERQVAFEEAMRLDMGQLLSIPFIIVGAAAIAAAARKPRGAARAEKG